MLISIIIPVYNIEKFVSECIQSVIAQDYKNWECILVDDGSSDGCSQICDAFSSFDSRIRVIHKKNEGLAAARNSGLQSACGEYVYFLDGDDKIDSTTISKLLSATDNGKVDFVIGHMASFYDGNSFKPFSHVVREEWVNGCSGKEAFTNIINMQGNIMMGVRGLYKKQFLVDNDLYFDPYFRYSEDQEWTPRVFEKAATVASREEPLYLYRVGRPNSLMNSINPRKIELTLEIYDKWYEQIMRNQDDSFYLSLYKLLIDRYWEFHFKYPPMLEKKQYPVFFKMMDERKVYAQKRPSEAGNSRRIWLINKYSAKTLCCLTYIWKKLHR